RSQDLATRLSLRASKAGSETYTKARFDGIGNAQERGRKGQWGMPMGQHASLKPASRRSRTLGSTLRLPTPLVSFGRPSLFGAAVANTRLFATKGALHGRDGQWPRRNEIRCNSPSASTA